MATSDSFNIQHQITLYGQPTNMSCWSAATTMLLGNRFSAGPGLAALGPAGGLNSDVKNIQTFAQGYHLHLYYPQSWTAAGLVEVVRRGPVVLMGPIPSGHAVVIAGIRGDGTEVGTELTIYDPWPPNLGRIYTVNYQDLMTRFPMATMYLLQDW